MLIEREKGLFSIEDLTFTTAAPESEEAQEVIRSLSQIPKTLNPKYFYDQLGSQLFEQICSLPEYYPTRTEASILEEYAPEIASITGTCQLVELGSGSSSKTRFLLSAYQEGKYACEYVPIDVSKSAIAISVGQLHQDYPDLSIKALVGSYERAIAYLKFIPIPRRMIFFLGSSLGNFNPSECDRFFDNITSILSKGDYFLLGVDLEKSPTILEAAYNDSQGITAAFNLNMLNHLNKRFGGNFDVNFFAHEAIYNTTAKQIEMYLTSQKEQVVRLENIGLTIDLKDQESILTEISRKFNLEKIQVELQSKGLKTLKTYTDNNNWFALILCQKR